MSLHTTSKFQSGDRFLDASRLSKVEDEVQNVLEDAEKRILTLSIAYKQKLSKLLEAIKKKSQQEVETLKTEARNIYQAINKEFQSSKTFGQTNRQKIETVESFLDQNLPQNEVSKTNAPAMRSVGGVNRVASTNNSSNSSTVSGSSWKSSPSISSQDTHSVKSVVESVKKNYNPNNDKKINQGVQIQQDPVKIAVGAIASRFENYFTKTTPASSSARPQSSSSSSARTHHDDNHHSRRHHHYSWNPFHWGMCGMGHY
jgi:hypothetical protein